MHRRNDPNSDSEPITDGRRWTVNELYALLGHSLAEIHALLRDNASLAGSERERAILLTEESIEQLRRMFISANPPAAMTLDEVNAAIGDLAGRYPDHQIFMEPAAVQPGNPSASIVGLPACRVVAEAVANAIGHARSETIRIKIDLEPSGDSARPDWLAVSVIDDGAGFSVDEVVWTPDGENPLPCGLIYMRQRAEEFGGRLELHSEPGRGTSVLLRLPWLTSA
ncbi:MAG: ATP-binding protein [Planctomycetota bacterium]